MLENICPYRAYISLDITSILNSSIYEYIIIPVTSVMHFYHKFWKGAVKKQINFKKYVLGYMNQVSQMEISSAHTQKFIIHN